MTSRDREDILTLFGTIPNALKRLGVDGEISYQKARRVLQGETAAGGRDSDLILDAWRAWCRQFLLSHVLLRDDYRSFTVTPDVDGEALEDELRGQILARQS